MFSKIAKDRVVITLVILFIAFFGVYQVGGGENSESVSTRNCLNIAWYIIFPTLLGYLVIRPVLRKSLEKSTSTKAKIGKTALGIFVGIIIATAGMYLLFTLAFGLAMNSG